MIWVTGAHPLCARAAAWSAMLEGIWCCRFVAGQVLNIGSLSSSCEGGTGTKTKLPSCQATFETDTLPNWPHNQVEHYQKCNNFQVLIGFGLLAGYIPPADCGRLWTSWTWNTWGFPPRRWSQPPMLSEACPTYRMMQAMATRDFWKPWIIHQTRMKTSWSGMAYTIVYNLLVGQLKQGQSGGFGCSVAMANLGQLSTDLRRAPGQFPKSWRRLFEGPSSRIFDTLGCEAIEFDVFSVSWKMGVRRLLDCWRHCEAFFPWRGLAIC